MKKWFLISVLIVLTLLVIIFFFFYLKNSEQKGQKAIRVGAILPMTGNAANYGELMKRGIKIAVDEFNSAGKSTPHLEVIIEDSQSNPRDGVSAMYKLLHVNKVVAVMPALSSVVLACVPIAEKNEIVLLNCPANSPKLRGAGRFVFNIMILSDQESEFLADYAFNEMGVRSAGIFFVNNASGRGYRDSFSDKFSKLGGIVKLSEGHEQGATDFRAIIEKFRSASVDFVFMTSYYSETAIFLRQSKELGFNTKWLSYSSVETPDFLKLAGDTAEGVIYSQPGFDVTSNDPVTKKFVTEYRKQYGEDPDFWGAYFYEGTRLLGIAVASGACSGQDIRHYLADVQDFFGITGTISFDNNGCVEKPVQFKVIRSGKFEYINR